MDGFLFKIGLHILVEHYSKSAILAVRSQFQKLKAITTRIFKSDRLTIIYLCDRQ